ncbi:MAG: hypothetical protein AAB075_08150 [Gemmatimonadota bacterium]
MMIHPGHQELHGITVIVETTGPITHVGRFDREDEGGVRFKDVASFAASSEEDLAAWLDRIRKFGVRVEHEQIVLPSAEIRSIRLLGLP